MTKSTDPDFWFLDESQINRYPPYTAGNNVTPLIDGAVYMADLYKKLQSMGAGDCLHIAAWRISPQERLIRDGTDERSVLDIVRDLISNGVYVRAMIWHFPGSEIGYLISPAHAHGNIEFVSSINNMRCHSGIAILDNRLPRGGFSSHHQKTAILSSGGTEYAYVGGTDIAVDRWDTPLHNSPFERTRNRFDAWHDVQSVISGPAAGQIWDNFTERWNDPTPPHPRTMAPGGLTPSPIDLSIRPIEIAGTGSHFVQVLRTLASGVYNFCPHGEQTVSTAYEKAIDKAEHYIYIEDQYFWPCSVVDKLGKAADRGVKIILVLAHRLRSLISPWYNYLRDEALKQIQAHHPENVFVYNLRQWPNRNIIWVHSKLMIIDDCFSAIGSANINRRSMATDSELQIAVVDRATESGRIGGKAVTVCCFAKELRLRLWMEHLGISDSRKIDDPVEESSGKPTGWPSVSNSAFSTEAQQHHAVVNAALQPCWSRPKWMIDRFFNP